MEGPLVIDRQFLSDCRLSRSIDDYPEGIILPIDKPWRWTSADVIRKVKWLACKHFRKRNLKVGHAGTLDPLATGTLLVCIGKATRLAESLQREGKEYVAGISFGATTPSYDLEKAIDRTWPVDNVSQAALQEILPHFLGEQEQVAPLFSAKSVDGVRAYELARKQYKQAGLAKTDAIQDFDHSVAELLNRQIINIYDIELLGFYPHGFPQENFIVAGQSSDDVSGMAETTADDEMTETVEGQAKTAANNLSEVTDGQMATAAKEIAETADTKSIAAKALRPNPNINWVDTSELHLPGAEIRIACSKGTYIRALARDIGEALSSGAHLHHLRRTKSGNFTAEASLSVADAMKIFDPS